MTNTVSLRLSSAIKMLNDSESLEGLFVLLKDLDPKCIPKLAPLLKEALVLENEFHAKYAIERLLSLHPSWINAHPGKDEGHTPLARAVFLGYFDIIDLLIEKGADPRQKASGRNALDIAAAHNANHRIQDALARSLLERVEFTPKEKSFALALAAKSSNLGATRALLDHGANFSVEITSDYTDEPMGNALTAACFQREQGSPSFEIVKLMLQTKNGQKVINEGWENEGFGAPIHCASFNDNKKVLSLLLQMGAQVNPPGYLSEENPKTPLMCAASGLNPEIVQTLLDHGADATLTDVDGKNALHHLAEADSPFEDEEEELTYFLPIIQALILAGANPETKDNNGFSAWELAYHCHHSQLGHHLKAAAENQALHASIGQKGLDKPKAKM